MGEVEWACKHCTVKHCTSIVGLLYAAKPTEAYQLQLIVNSKIPDHQDISRVMHSITSQSDRSLEAGIAAASGPGFQVIDCHETMSPTHYGG